MATETTDDGPVRIPIEDEPADDGADESTEGGRSIGVTMLLLAVVAAAVIYFVVLSGDDDEEMEPPF